MGGKKSAGSGRKSSRDASIENIPPSDSTINVSSINNDVSGSISNALGGNAVSGTNNVNNSGLSNISLPSNFDYNNGVLVRTPNTLAFELFQKDNPWPKVEVWLPPPGASSSLNRSLTTTKLTNFPDACSWIFDSSDIDKLVDMNGKRCSIHLRQLLLREHITSLPPLVMPYPAKNPSLDLVLDMVKGAHVFVRTCDESRQGTFISNEVSSFIFLRHCQESLLTAFVIQIMDQRFQKEYNDRVISAVVHCFKRLFAYLVCYPVFYEYDKVIREMLLGGNKPLSMEKYIAGDYDGISELHCFNVILTAIGIHPKLVYVFQDLDWRVLTINQFFKYVTSDLVDVTKNVVPATVVFQNTSVCIKEDPVIAKNFGLANYSQRLCFVAKTYKHVYNTVLDEATALMALASEGVDVSNWATKLPVRKAVSIPPLINVSF